MGPKLIAAAIINQRHTQPTLDSDDLVRVFANINLKKPEHII